MAELVAVAELVAEVEFVPVAVLVAVAESIHLLYGSKPPTKMPQPSRNKYLSATKVPNGSSEARKPSSNFTKPQPRATPVCSSRMQ